MLGFLVATAVAAPHFIRNWVFYGDPLYPFAQRLFPGCHPRMPDSALEAETIISHWGTLPPADPWQRLVEAVRLAFNFSFHTHAGYTNDVPVYGSLFTLCLPLVLLVPKARRAWVVVVLGLAVVFGWAWTYRVDRNLQVVTPLLAVATAALLARAWRVGHLARLGVAALVLVQVAWSGDHFFLGNDRIDSAIALIRSGFDGRAASRFDGYRADYLALGRALPRDAKVLLHNDHGNLGIDRPVLLDWLGMQGLIDARTFHSPRDAWDRYRELGITHIVYRPGLHPAPVKQEDVVFAAFLERYASRAEAFGELHLLAVPDDPPPIEPAYRVLVVGIGGYADGVYEIAALGANEGLPWDLQQRGGPLKATTTTDEAAAQLGAVDAVLLARAAAAVRGAPALASDFHSPVSYAEFAVWVRTAPRPR